ncbi:MAG TPA: RNA polymerase sigma factor [Planctomycetota bacterium]|nr:RNA polymerase sigma factor [Planctomycetota bacterium]
MTSSPSTPETAAPDAPRAASVDDAVARHAGEIAAFLAHHAGDAATGSDLAQDVFETAFRRQNDVRDPGAVRAWLFRIAVNRFHDHLRGKRRRPPPEPLPDAVDRREAGPERAALRRELEDVLRDAVAALPERQRGVFLLHGVEGFDHALIGATLGLGAGAVKTALYHAREKLRVRLGRYLGLDGREGGAP